MDLVKRDALLKKVGNPNEAPVPVTLEDFFVGNDDGASIWCNLQNPVPPGKVFDILKRVRERPGVSDVVVVVTQYDGGEEEWPFSDRIYVFTTATPDEVLTWLEPDQAPDECWLATEPEELKRLPVPVRMHAIGLWWD